MNKHLKNLRLGGKMIFISLFLGIESFFFNINFWLFLPSLFVAIIFSTAVQYKVVHRILSTATSIKHHDKLVKAGFAICHGLMAVSSAVLIGEAANTESELRIWGHIVFVTGVATLTAYVFGNIRMLIHRLESNQLLQKE